MIPTSELLNPKKIFKRLNLEEGMKVADFGCGNSGYFVFAAAHIVGKEGMVYGVDILKPALESIKSRAQFDGVTNIMTVWSNLEIYEATAIAAESLDRALIVSVLHQSEKNIDIIRECVRMIRPSGKILVIDWKRTASPLGPSTDRRPLPSEIISMAEKSGLRLESEFEPGQYHFGLIFSKK